MGSPYTTVPAGQTESRVKCACNKPCSLLSTHFCTERKETVMFAIVGDQTCTFFPGLGDDISSTLAHHLGDVKRAVGLIGHSYGPVDRLSLHLHHESRYTLTFRWKYRRIHCNGLFSIFFKLTALYTRQRTPLELSERLMCVKQWSTTMATKSAEGARRKETS